MRPFDELTVTGRQRRLRRLAVDAAEQFTPGIGYRWSFVAESFNTIFRADTAAGSSWSVRVGAALRIHADATEAVEAAWLSSLRRDLALAVPEMRRTPDGSPTVRQRHPAVPGERVCTMSRWVEGRPATAAMSAGIARQMGSLAAILHAHTASAPTPGADADLVADRVLYWRIPDRLRHVPTDGALLEEAHDRSQDLLDTLWRDRSRTPQLLHGDLTPGNFIETPHGLTPIDFQDLIVGFDVQDLAISLLSLERYDDDGDELAQAFRTGYATVRAWPELDRPLLDALVAMRTLHLINLALSRRKPGLESYLSARLQRLNDWMRPHRPHAPQPPLPSSSDGPTTTALTYTDPHASA